MAAWNAVQIAHKLYVHCMRLTKRPACYILNNSATRVFMSVRPPVHSFVSLSIVSVEVVHAIGGTNRYASWEFKTGEVKSGINQ